MATQNLTRTKGMHKKKTVSTFVADLSYADISTSADIYQLVTLPPEVIVTKASAVVVTAFDSVTSAVLDMGFGGNDALIDGGDLKGAANSELAGGVNAVVPVVLQTGGVVTIVPTYTGATTEGRIIIEIEYLEYTKASGEVTDFVA